MNERQRLLGAVLAGGRSSRFGGDKALALLQGKPLLLHAVDAIRPNTDKVVICGRQVSGYDCLSDRPRPDLGPLGGLNAALHHAAGNGFQGVLTIACDMPFFPNALARSLLANGPAIVEDQYMMGYWPAALALKLDEHVLGTADRSMRAWLAAVQPRILPAPPLPNINTVDDLNQLEQEMG
jgi:molybdopterin-guanine dinucleotide biosynthesis protein A